MAPLLFASTICTVLLLAAFLFLQSSVYRVLRRLWANQQRERLLSFANEFSFGQDAVVFVGGTQVADFRWEEHFQNRPMRNLGIPDETVDELNQRLPAIAARQPKVILLHCGDTDVRLGYRTGTIIRGMEHALSTVHQSSPDTAVVVLGILPQYRRQAAKIRLINQRLAEFALQRGYSFIEAFADLADSGGGLNPEFSADGYHLLGAGYEVLLGKVTGYL